MAWYLVKCKMHLHIRGCIQKSPNWVSNKIYAYNNKHSLRSNTKGYGGNVQNSDTTAPSRSSHARRSVRKLLDAPSFLAMGVVMYTWVSSTVSLRTLFSILHHSLIGLGLPQGYSAELRAGWLVFRVPAEAGSFSLHRPCPDWSWSPPSLLTNGYQQLFSFR
jgi:hypothetical protein